MSERAASVSSVRRSASWMSDEKGVQPKRQGAQGEHGNEREQERRVKTPPPRREVNALLTLLTKAVYSLHISDLLD